MRGVEGSAKLSTKIKDAPPGLITRPPEGRVPKEELCP
jgi:hypothetical protein